MRAVPKIMSFSLTLLHCKCKMIVTGSALQNTLHLPEYTFLASYSISLVIRQGFFLPKPSQKLDPSHKTDLDLWDCSGRVKLVL